MRDEHVLIIGAGIGGLTAALALQSHGLRVTLFERARELREFGAGLVLSPNAMHALHHLGIADRIAEMSSRHEQSAVKHYATGETLRQRPPAATYREKYGADYLQVHRQDLHAALSEAVLARDPGCIRTGHAFTGLSQDDWGVTARFRNGESERGDALIGSDGGASTVRAVTSEPDGPDPVVYTGRVAFRALVPAEALTREIIEPSRCMYIGPDRLLLHYFLRRDTVMNIVGIARQPSWQLESWAAGADISEFQALYHDFHPAIRAMIAAIPPGRLFKWGLHDREPLQQWTRGRVSMLGDAAHPMSPFLGQGAAMAIEDGMVLGRCFAGTATVEGALRRFEAARKSRANGVQLQSREQANAFHGSAREQFNPGRDAEDRDLFKYNPVTAPI